MSAEKIKKPLKVIMTINSARGLLWELVANYPFSEDDTDRIIRCLRDLKNLNLILQKQDNVSNNVAKPTLQHLEAKNDKIELLKSALKYSNSTAQLALSLIRSIDSLNKSAIARDLEEMITKIKIVLNDKSEE